jgi:hypothetical protein
MMSDMTDDTTLQMSDWYASLTPEQRVEVKAVAAEDRPLPAWALASLGAAGMPVAAASPQGSATGSEVRMPPALRDFLVTDDDPEEL